MNTPLKSRSTAILGTATIPAGPVVKPLPGPILFSNACGNGRIACPFDPPVSTVCPGGPWIPCGP